VWHGSSADGIDDRPVVPDRIVKSSGSERTFPEDVTDIEEMRRHVATLAGESATWLTSRSLFARTVTLKVRYSDFATITRSHTAPPTRDREAIVGRALQLLSRTAVGERPVRLLGVSVHNLGDSVEDKVAPSLPLLDEL
jgi:DNA polymerase-4